MFAVGEVQKNENVVFGIRCHVILHPRSFKLKRSLKLKLDIILQTKFHNPFMHHIEKWSNLL